MKRALSVYKLFAFMMLGVFGAPQAHAVLLRLDYAYYVRQPDGGKAGPGVAMVQIGDQAHASFPAGIEFDIPSKYEVKLDGTVNPGLTLAKWKRTAEADGREFKPINSPYKDANTGNLLRTNFYPVPVPDAPAIPGLTPGQMVYISLDAAIRDNRMHVVQPGEHPIVQSDPPRPAPVVPPAPAPVDRSDPNLQQHEGQTQFAANSGECAICHPQPGPLLQGLDVQIAAAMKNISNTSLASMHVRTESMRLGALSADYRANFNATCGGVRIDDFLAVLDMKAAALDYPMPPDIPRALMAQESSAKCNAEQPRKEEIGLFQIKPATAKAAGVAECAMEYSNECRNYLMSPYGSMNAMFKVTADLRSHITQSVLSDHIGSHHYTAPGLNPDRMSSREMWRAVILTFNGSPRWLTKALADISQFNQANPTAHADPNDWNVIKLFLAKVYVDDDDLSWRENTVPININEAEVVVPDAASI